MYLTRLRLDPRSAQVRRDLADPYEMHRTLVRAFVADGAQTPPRILWRVEPEAAWSMPVLLVQAEQEADWTRLQQLPSYLQQAQPWETKSLTPEQWLQVGKSYRFRLFANPTVTREGKRYGLQSEQAQLDWLARQGQRLGFVVEAALVSNSDLIEGRKGTQHISLQRACFEGRLKVSDRDAVLGALRAGIGPGKAFGCGLLSLAPV